jgi:hypothetical protein
MVSSQGKHDDNKDELNLIEKEIQLIGMMATKA